MAIRTKDEILEIIKTKIGDDISDDSLSFIEDITDTLNDYEERLSDSTDWEKKYTELDNEWREKYKSRFFAPATDVVDDEEKIEDTEKESTNLSYEDLFEDENKKKGDE